MRQKEAASLSTLKVPEKPNKKRPTAIAAVGLSSYLDMMYPLRCFDFTPKRQRTQFVR
jgi:hypothetical protein